MSQLTIQCPWMSTNSDGSTTWIWGSLGVGHGAGGSLGSTNTYLINVNGTPLVWNF